MAGSFLGRIPIPADHCPILIRSNHGLRNSGRWHWKKERPEKRNHKERPDNVAYGPGIHPFDDFIPRTAPRNPVAWNI